FLGFNKAEDPNAKALVRKRNIVHFVFSVLMLLVILVFRLLNDDSVVTAIFTAASYTYGPLLGLFAFGILTRRSVNDNLVPYICLLSPVIWYLLNTYYLVPYTDYRIGFELIVYNGLTTFLLMWVTSRPKYGQTLIFSAIPDNCAHISHANRHVAPLV